MDFELLKRTISNILHVSVLAIVESDADVRSLLNAFEKKYCFSRELQPMLTADGILTLLGQIGPNAFYETGGKLRTGVTIFSFAGYKFVVGPYARDVYNERLVQETFAANRLSYSRVYEFRLYYTALPLLTASVLTNVLSAIIAAFDPNAPVYDSKHLEMNTLSATSDATEASVLGLSAHTGSEHTESITRAAGSHSKANASGSKKDDSGAYSDAADSSVLEAVYQRYRFENKFLECIRNGEREAALHYFDRMATLRAAQGGLGEIYQDPRVSYSILRTLVRKAAEEGGLSVITIDTLTQKQAQLSAAASTYSEQGIYIHDLIRDLCDAVRDSRISRDGCSPETRTIMEYLHFHYADPVRIDDLAALTNYSRAHISRTFKQDTGRSITEYIAHLRCRKAKTMLESTSIPIAEISTAVGYPDSNYFVKVFKADAGVTPSAYRSEHHR